MKIIDKIVKKYKCHKRLYISGYHINDFFRSIPEALCFKDVKKHIDNFKLVSEPSIAKYNFPKEYPGYFRRDSTFPSRYAYCLNDVYVNSMTGACGTKNVAFQESYGSLRFWLRREPLYISSFNPTYENVEKGTCIAPASYYHFMIELLPRLIYVLETYKNVPIYYYHDIPGYVYSVIEYIADKYDRKLVPTNNKLLHFKNYYFTQAFDKSGFVPRVDIQMIRHTFLENANKSHATPSKKVYISRRNSQRRLVNENELEECLRANGYDILLTENISFQDKIGLFQDVHTVIAPHGAGLTNIIWGNPGTRVIEIFSTHNNDCYARLAVSLGMNYNYISAEYNGDRGWNISINKLLNIL